LTERTESWAELGIDRLIVYVARPFEEGVAGLHAIVSQM